MSFRDLELPLILALIRIALTLAAPVLTFLSLVICLTGKHQVAWATFMTGIVGFVVGLFLVARARRD